MADKNRKDTFHWNFDLKNTDSDFTDIEYSPEVIPVAEGEDDLKPFIFVDGKYNSDTDSSAFSEGDRSSSAGKTSRDPDDYDDEYDEPEKKKKGSSGKLSPSAIFGNNNIPWKKILIGAGILLALVLAVILLWPKKGEEPKTEDKKWALTEDASIKLLVENYFTALKDGNQQLMKNVLVSDAKIEEVTLWNQSKIYESFENTKSYTYPGINKGEYCVAAFSDIKFVHIDTLVPKTYFFYARPEGESNQLRLMVMDDDSTPEYKYFANVYKDNSSEIQSLVQDSNNRYKQALASDDKLATYTPLWEKGDYSIPPEGTLYPPQTPDQTQDVPPSGSTENPDVTTVAPVEGDEIPMDAKAWVLDGPLRLRSTPDTSDNSNVLTHLSKYHYVRIVGQIGDWYHIVDNLSENGIGGEQTPSNQEGYVKVDYLTQNYAHIPND